LFVKTFQCCKRASNLETPIIRQVSKPVLHFVIAKFLTSHYINTKQQITCCDVTLGYVSSYVVAFSVFIYQQEKMCILIYIQQDATLHSLFISGNSSTCFGWYLQPSSGAHTTVSTASGICHTVTAICRYRERVRTGLRVLWVAYTISSTGNHKRI
jgi:hypothetical protein